MLFWHLLSLSSKDHPVCVISFIHLRVLCFIFWTSVSLCPCLQEMVMTHAAGLMNNEDRSEVEQESFEIGAYDQTGKTVIAAQGDVAELAGKTAAEGEPGENAKLWLLAVLSEQKMRASHGKSHDNAEDDWQISPCVGSSRPPKTSSQPSLQKWLQSPNYLKTKHSSSHGRRSYSVRKKGKPKHSPPLSQVKPLSVASSIKCFEKWLKKTRGNVCANTIDRYSRIIRQFFSSGPGGWKLLPSLSKPDGFLVKISQTVTQGTLAMYVHALKLFVEYLMSNLEAFEEVSLSTCLELERWLMNEGSASRLLSPGMSQSLSKKSQTSGHKAATRDDSYHASSHYQYVSSLLCWAVNTLVLVFSI